MREQDNKLCSGFSADACSSSSPDAPYLRIYLQTTRNANANTRTIEINGNLVANISRMSVEVHGELEANRSSSLDVKKELIANFSTNGVNGFSNANISSNSTVEVYEGRDVILTSVIESYPPIRNQYWMIPTSINNNNNTVYEESYTTNGCRLAC